MDINHIILYGTTALAVLHIIMGLNIFARNGEIKSLEAKIMETLAKNYLSKDTYADNHKALQEQMLQLQHDISDVKSLLITAVTEIKNKCWILKYQN